jgi:hypothetical protein
MSHGTMLDGLHRIRQEGGRLVGADYVLVEGKREWLTAIGLRFEHLAAVFRVQPEDDSISFRFGEMQAEKNELVVPSGESSFWPQCCGARLSFFCELVSYNDTNFGPLLFFFDPTRRFETSIWISASQAIMSVSEMKITPEFTVGPRAWVITGQGGR